MIVLHDPPSRSLFLERDRNGRFTGKVGSVWIKWFGEFIAALQSVGLVSDAAEIDSEFADTVAPAADRSDAIALFHEHSENRDREPTLADLLSLFQNDATGSKARLITAPVADLLALYPAAGYPEALFSATDTAQHFYSTGAAWIEFYELTDAVTAAVTPLLNLVHKSSGTPAAGFGAGLRTRLHSSTNVLRDAGYTDVVWSAATNAAESADFVVRLMAAGAAAAEKFRITSAGNLKLAGKVSLYNNAAPVNGHLLIGNTAGVSFDAALLSGTAGQVVVTNGAGAITLSLPQSIATTNSPTFANLNLAGTNPILDLNDTGGSLPIVRFRASGVAKWTIQTDAAQTNLQVWDQTAGAFVMQFTAGGDLFLAPAGVVKFGTRSAIGAETLTGFIPIKDSGGTTRKLAVVS